MNVCYFFRRNACKYGDRCRNEHVPLTTPLKSVKYTEESPPKFPFTQLSICGDLTLHLEKPSWALSSYGPSSYAPSITPCLDQSPEELRLKAMTAGSVDQYIHYEATHNEAANDIFDYMRSNVPKTYQEATINHLDTQSAKPENPSRKTTSPYWISMPAYPPTLEPEPRQLADRKHQALLPAAEQTIPASTKAPSTSSPQSNVFVPSNEAHRSETPHSPTIMPSVPAAPLRHPESPDELKIRMDVYCTEMDKAKFAEGRLRSERDRYRDLRNSAVEEKSALEAQLASLEEQRKIDQERCTSLQESLHASQQEASSLHQSWIDEKEERNETSLELAAAKEAHKLAEARYRKTSSRLREANAELKTLGKEEINLRLSLSLANDEAEALRNELAGVRQEKETLVQGLTEQLRGSCDEVSVLRMQLDNARNQEKEAADECERLKVKLQGLEKRLRKALSVDVTGLRASLKTEREELKTTGKKLMDALATNQALDMEVKRLDASEKQAVEGARSVRDELRASQEKVEAMEALLGKERAEQRKIQSRFAHVLAVNEVLVRDVKQLDALRVETVHLKRRVEIAERRLEGSDVDATTSTGKRPCAEPEAGHKPAKVRRRPSVQI